MGSLIAGIISAAVGGIAGMASSLWGDKEARGRIAKEKEYQKQLYELNKKEAEEKYKQAKEQAERNAAQTEIEADLTDKSLDVTEQGISNDFNAAIDQMYLSQESDAWTWNTAAMQAGSSEGAAYSNIASSGVRAGSSLNDAVQMESATNAAQLQFSQDAKRRSDDNNLASVLNDLAGNKFAIQQNRIGADIARDNAQYLRNSYAEGGRNYNLYQLQLEELKANYDYKNEQLDYEYGQHSGWNSFWNSFIKLNTGGAQGFNTGYNIGETFRNASKPKTNNYTTSVGGGRNG